MFLLWLQRFINPQKTMLEGGFYGEYYNMGNSWNFGINCLIHSDNFQQPDNAKKQSRECMEPD